VGSDFGMVLAEVAAAIYEREHVIIRCAGGV
jgi:hypothetical protein